MNVWSDNVTLFSWAIRGYGELPEGVAVCPNYSVATAMDIYRNNFRGNLQDVLASTYPVAEQIVGKDFFRMMAREFIGQHPSRSGNLHHYGAELGDFISTYAPAQELIYLADVARLEWACHLAYFAADAEILDVGRLATVAPKRYAYLRLLLHPACKVVRSGYPIATIWHAHQPGMPEAFHVDLDSGPQHVLVSRKHDVVSVQVLVEPEACWLQHIQAGAPLGAAMAVTQEQHPDFDLQSALSKLVSQDVLMDFELIDDQEE